ncbi:hypothetical protein [Parendozoicomonas sp. Alg238-R29]|uniref:hypothetical protein n=1 Tax=Parendozoicomonas sp. Alg238-R29 TaxID=2993446 RepID=UPI00248F34C0|nr:hypothetical protein [Parendozoicomonas sp. Alg238-R29]
MQGKALNNAPMPSRLICSPAASPAAPTLVVWPALRSSRENLVPVGVLMDMFGAVIGTGGGLFVARLLFMMV